MSRKIPARRQKRKAPAKRNQPVSTVRYERHPLYGEIALIEHSYEYEGKTYAYWRYDFDWRPELPPGAVRGNPHAQGFLGMGVPRYFYVDETHRCVQCGRDFVFAAAEQKYWYETLKFNTYSTAIRCPECRRRRRSLKSLLHGIQQAAAQVEAAACDPRAQLAYAEALIAYHAASGKGDLSKAIAACREARRLDPSLSESLYFEAEAQWLRGLQPKAADAYRAWLESTGKPRAWVRIAEQRLAEAEALSPFTEPRR